MADFLILTVTSHLQANTKAVAWNKSNQGIAYYKLGFFIAKKLHPKGYDAINKALTTDAVIVNANAPKGDNNIYIVNLLTNNILKPRALVYISQRNNDTKNEVEALLDTAHNLISLV